MRVAMRDDHRVARAARRRGAAHVRRDRRRARAGWRCRARRARRRATGTVSRATGRMSAHGQAAARGPPSRASLHARGDELLRDDRLRVDPCRPRATCQRAEARGARAPRADACAAALHATLLAGPCARSRRRSRRRRARADPGGAAAWPRCRSAAASPVRSPAAGSPSPARSFTRAGRGRRHVHRDEARVRAHEVVLERDLHHLRARLVAASAPRVISSIGARSCALAQRAPTPAALRSRDGVSATLQGWLPRMPETMTRAERCAGGGGHDDRLAEVEVGHARAGTSRRACRRASGSRRRAAPAPRSWRRAAPSSPAPPARRRSSVNVPRPNCAALRHEVAVGRRADADGEEARVAQALADELEELLLVVDTPPSVMKITWRR